MVTRRLLITGIGTDVGKTVASAVVCQALGANYWKPVQSGGLQHTDTDEIARLSGGAVVCHPEAFRLQTPCSPDRAAEIDNCSLSVAGILQGVPDVSPLVIEGAGGLLVPINPEETMADLFTALGGVFVLVSRAYLGSINHTLLTVAEMRRRGGFVGGIVFTGEPNPASERSIQQHSGLPILARIPQLGQLDSSSIASVVASVGPELRAWWSTL
jgi:dethiobiotin synthetase